MRIDDHTGSSAYSVIELRELAREAGVGPVAAPAPVRLDSLGQELHDLRRRVAALPKASDVLRRLNGRAKAS